MAEDICHFVKQDDRLCLLLIIGGTTDGYKEAIVIKHAYQESKRNLDKLFNSLQTLELNRIFQGLLLRETVLGFLEYNGKIFLHI
ncbi:MAG: hypothetical protein ACTS8R_02910 [Arsenophonus sp. NC-QC1-MAG3]